MQKTGSNRRWISVSALVATICAAATVAFAGQAAPITIPLFNGQIGDAGNLRLGSWGSGKAEANKDARLVGDTAIRITTQNLFSGARLDFVRPIDLANAFKQNNTYMRFQIRFIGGANAAGAGGGIALGGGSNRGGEFDGPGSSGPQGFGGGDGSGVVSPFRQMRFLFTMADGTRFEATRDVVVPPTEDPNDYIPLSIPLAALLKKNGDATSAPTGPGAQLKSVAIFGDRYRQFFLGEITIITDETEISVQPVEEQIAFVNNTLTFVADAEGGASTLKYLWDFDASDGIQDDAEGRVVNKTFSRAGTFKMTLTVVDADDLKRPATTSVELSVAE